MPLETHLPDPIVSPVEGSDPERAAVLGDAVGLALAVVLDSLTPAERVAFVLHDIFAVPFEAIAPIVGRTPTTARQLASRARRQVQGAPMPDVDLDGQWAIVDAFLAAARAGAFDQLVAVLDPDVVLRSDGGKARPELNSHVRGAQAIVGQALTFRQFAATATRVLVNGIPGGVAWAPESLCDPGPDSQGWEDRCDRHLRGSGAAWQAGSHRGRGLRAPVLQASFKHSSSVLRAAVTFAPSCVSPV